MKKLAVLLLLVVLASCQQAPKSQVFTSGPDVDNIQKTIDAYVAGDWAAFKAAYADTATSTHNKNKMDMDSLMRFHQNSRNAYEKVEIETIAKEMVRYEDGSQWTHFWGVWKGTIKGSGQVVEVPMHIAGHVVQGKITEDYLFYDPTPIVEALTPPPAMTPNK